MKMTENNIDYSSECRKEFLNLYNITLYLVHIVVDLYLYFFVFEIVCANKMYIFL